MINSPEEEEMIEQENAEEVVQAEDIAPQDLVVVSDQLPKEIPIIAIGERPLFPGINVPLFLKGDHYIKQFKELNQKGVKVAGVVMVKRDRTEEGKFPILYEVGTVVRLYKVVPVEENAIHVVVQGLQRFKKKKQVKSEGNYETWQVEYHADPGKKPKGELKAYALAVMSAARKLLKANPIIQEQLKILLSHLDIERPGLLFDIMASMLSVDAKKLQDLLETYKLNQRAEKLLVLMQEEIDLLELQANISKQIETKVNQQQKEFFLREQLKIIKKELGIEKDDKSMELEQLQERIEKLELSDEARHVVENEMRKLEALEPISPEYGITRNYLEILTDLPWGITTEDVLNIKQADKILNEDHYGLDEVKSRILEYISTIIKKGKLTGTNILLVGPPGVGKTSIGKSIAHALGREFYRFSVGGMNDEAEIKGHRKTYIGAMPGKLIEALRRTKTSNPVIMLDELDKVGASYKGDPASALLEVLDPEQNHSFLDHYLDVRFDLSKVLFIATANQLDTIPGPLLDRMEIIRLSGYITEEKVQIAKRYLVPKQREAHGLTSKEVIITEAALRQIVEGYAREAGVRNLENHIKKIMRQVTLKQAHGEEGNFSINLSNLEEFLGKPNFTTEELYNKNVPGVALGLAYTAMGGATLYIEAIAVPSKNGSIKYTGKLGDVMQESAAIAYSYVRSLLSGEQETAFFDENAVHIHVPAGATPKDGPSAGITIALALYSLATGRAVRGDLAMTGELTLTGKVLPIGGVREKTIAARRVKMNHIIFPKDNQKDFEELPDYIKEGIQPHFANYFADVLEIAYLPKKKKKKKAKKQLNGQTTS